MPADVITEHRVTHPEIDVDGDEATGIWYLQDKVIVPKFDFMLIGAASITTATGAPPTAGRSASPATTAPTTPRCRPRTRLQGESRSGR